MLGRSLFIILGWLGIGALCVMIQGKKKTAPVTPAEGERLHALHSVLPLVRFECQGRLKGYYGDMDFGCSVFHFCTDGGQRFTYKCNEGLKFNEMTTSCSAAYFGDCSHPELVGPAGSNKSSGATPLESFQKIPVYKSPEEKNLAEPGDYPEPFIQHYDPALDLEYNYEYYDTELADTLPSPSKTVTSFVKRSPPSSIASPMTSALSAFASLANMPFEFTSSKDQAIDHSDSIDRGDYFDPVDRAFIALPPPRRRTSYTHSSRPSSQFLQLPFLSGAGGKTSTHDKKLPKTQSQSPQLHQRPNTFDHNPPSEFELPSHFQRQPDYYDYDLSSGRTTPDAFRPSSLITDDSDEFQPVTPASKQPKEAREDQELVRPHREASPQQNRATSTSFQNFSPTSNNFPSTRGRFPTQSSFGIPQTSSRAIQTPSQTFLSSPRFPSSNNFIFQQPPRQSTGFNPQPFSSLTPPAPTRPSTQTFRSPSSSQFGDSNAPQRPNTGQSFSPPTFQGFGRPQAPQNVQTFLLPPQQGGATSTIGLPSSPQPGQGFSSSFNPPNSGQTFPRPTSFPQHIQTFTLPAGPPPSSSSFLRPQSGFNFGRPGTQSPPFATPTPSPFLIPTPVPTNTFTQPTTGFQDGRPGIRGQSRPTSPPISSQTENPRPLTPRPLIPRPLTPIHPLLDPNHSFQGTRPPVSVTSEKPGVLEGFDFHIDVLKEEEPKDQDDREPTTPPRQTTRGRPSTRPSTRPRPQTTRRRPSRPRRPTAQPTTTQPTTHPDDTQFDNQFGQTTRRRPVGSRLRPKPVSETTDDDSFPTTPLSTDIPELFPTFPGPPSFKDSSSFSDEPRTSDQPVFLNQPNFSGQPNFPNHPSFSDQPSFPGDFRVPPTFPGPPSFTSPSRFPGPIGQQRPNTFQPGIFQPQPDVFDHHTGFGGVTDDPHLPNDLHPQTGIRGGVSDDDIVTDNPVDVEEETNVIHPPDDEHHFVEEQTEPTPTTTSKPSTGRRRPGSRRRPSIRDRLNTRLSSRTKTTTTTTTTTTTPAPIEDYTEYYEYDYTDEPVTTQPPPTEPTTEATTTPRRSYAQRIRDRLRRLNSRRQNGASQTTPRSNGGSTTASPTHTTLRPGVVDNERFNRFRNRLRNRAKSRLTTTEAPEVDREDVETESLAEPDTSTRPTRRNRFNNFRSQRFNREGGNVLQVKEIIKNDQVAEETTRLEVSEPPNAEQSLHKTTQQEDKTAESDPQELRKSQVTDSATEIQIQEDDGIDKKEHKEESQTTPQGTQQDTQQEEPHQNTPSRPGVVRGRRINDPNFRARFREFLKNRKNRMSASYRTTEQPETQDTTGGEQQNQDSEKANQDHQIQEDQDQGKEEAHIQEQEKQEETPRPVIKERTAQTLEEQRKELRTMLLASRQAQSEERLSRRVPIRQFRNKVLERRQNKDNEKEEVTDQVGEETEHAEVQAREELPTESADTNGDGDAKGESTSTFAGFKPIIAPTRPSRPPKPQQRPQEPEIITAPPPGKAGTDIISFTVSADLSGKKEGSGSENAKPETPSLPPPSVMIVKEIGIDSPEEKVISKEPLPEIKLDTGDIHVSQSNTESHDVPVLIPIFSESSVGDVEKSKHESKLLVPLKSDSPTPTPAKSDTNSAEGNRTPLPLVPRTSKPSKPSFNLAAVFNRPRSKDIEGDGEGEVTPFPKITMATDAPFLPLEILIPLHKSR